MDGDLITSLAAPGSSSLSYSSSISINSTSQPSHHAGFKRSRDPSDDFALQLGQLAAPKLPVGPGGYGVGVNYGAGVMSNGAAGLSPNNNNDTTIEVSKKPKMDHHAQYHPYSSGGGGDGSELLGVGGAEEDGGGGGGYTRVVHIRNVPNTISEMEIIQLALPFGKVTNVLLLKNKSQAFLEFAEVQTAVTMVKFYNSDSVQPTLGGRTVFIQHSQHKELQTSGTHSNANATTQAAIQAAQTVAGGSGGGGGNGKVGNDPSPVLRVIVENMIYPITLETLLLIFKKYGKIAKIVTFTKNNTFQALVQYHTSTEADAAKVALNGQNIYNGCCNLRVDFSKMTNLSVKFNNDKSRDFTNPSLPSGEGNPNAPASAHQSKGHGHGPSNAPGILAPNPFAVNAGGFGGGGGGPKMDLAPTGPPPGPFGGMKGNNNNNNNHHNNNNNNIMPPHGGPYGGGPPGPPPNALGQAGRLGAPPGPPPSLNPALGALLQSLAGPLAALTANNPQQAALLASLGLGLNNNINNNNNPANMNNNGALFGRMGGGAIGGGQNLLGAGAGALNALNQFGGVGGGVGGGVLGAGLGSPNGGASSVGVVLLVSNLPEGPVTPDDLFTLFGVYGDVVRVKILYNKKDNALVQMADGTQALQAAQYMDKIRLYGKPIRVTSSKHTTVQMPKEGAPDGGLTKDFSNSPLHRFKKPGSKNYANVFAPSATLHLSNIPPNIEEETLVEAFGRHGRVKAFKFFPKDHKMALIGMESVDEAVIALVKMHNFQLADAAHLRVSFSKSNIQM